VGKALKRFEREMQRAVSDVLHQHVQPLFPDTVISVHHVIGTNDFGIAKVYIATFPEENVRKILTFLNGEKENKQVRHLIAQRIRNKVKRIPEFRFYEDELLKEMRKVEALLKQIKDEEE
jgi:ribosome-binding factor A